MRTGRRLVVVHNHLLPAIWAFKNSPPGSPRRTYACFSTDSSIPRSAPVRSRPFSAPTPKGAKAPTTNQPPCLSIPLHETPCHLFQSPIPNLQSPIPNLQSPIPILHHPLLTNQYLIAITHL